VTASADAGLSFDSVPVQYEVQQPFQMVRRLDRLDAQFLRGQIEPVHPIGRISEILRAIRIPTAEGREYDLFLFFKEHVHPCPIISILPRGVKINV
jgi:hypothetical protein